MRPSTAVSISLLLLLALPALAQPAPADTQAPGPALRDDPRVAQRLHLLATWVDAYRAYAELPGLSMEVVHDQDVLWRQGFGLADREAGVPATPETIYSICSISKLFTGIAAMQLRDRGLVELDEPVGTYLPWFIIEQTYPDGPPVTLWGLLTHSAGLPRESDYPYWSPPSFRFPTREEVHSRLAEQETLYPAQTYFQYSNLGLTLVGEIVAEVSGRPYDEVVRSQVLDPMGLADTRPEMPADLVGGRLATGYGAPSRNADGQVVRGRLPLFDARGITPAAGFSSTADDLAKFASWQLRVLDRETHEGEEILSRNTLREMQRVQWLDPGWEIARGLAFGVYRRDDVTYVGHSGSCPGYRTAVWIQADHEMAAVAMGNAGDAETELLVLRAHQIVTPGVEAALAALEEGKTVDPALLVYTGRYSVAPWGGEMAVIPWQDGLAVLDLPTDDPLDSLWEIRHVEANRFRRVRDDGELGEEIVFETDDAGNVTALVQHSNRWVRIDTP